MAAITEDYVSFETAKLLKEKRFPQSTFRCHYIIDGNDHYRSFENRCGFGDYDIIAPTLAVAMKWLREVYNVFISVNIGNHKTDNRDTSMPDSVYYFFYITDTKAVYEEEKQCHKEFATFEEACEAAIKYCLKNLI